MILSVIRKIHMSGKVAAFASYHVTLTNEVWSWSGLTPQGEIVLSLWKEEFNFHDRPPTYSNYNDPDSMKWKDSLGNRERIEHLKIVRDKRGGIFRVVISSAVNFRDYPRKINEAYPKPNMTMRLVEFDEDTGQFKAEVLESAYAQGVLKARDAPPT